LEGNLIEVLTVFKLPEHSRRRLRTSNMCEHINREIKHRTRVAGLFPNESSVLRLLTAIRMETSDEWETGRANFSDPSQP
jgi:putative transposase